MTAAVTRASAMAAVQQHRRAIDSLSKRPGVEIPLPVYHYKVFDDRQVLIAGDARRILTIPPDLDGATLFEVVISITTVSTSGIVQMQLRNIDNSDVDMLSTRIQIDQGELNSQDASTAYVINTANDEVSNKDRIAFDMDQVGTGAKGLEAVLTFLPAS